MKNKIVLFGCGILGHEAIDHIGSENIDCFCDNNAELHGTEKYGKIIISFDELKSRYSDAIILICADIRTWNAYAIAKQCEEGGIKDYLLYGNLRLKDFFTDHKELMKFLDNPLNRSYMKSEIYIEMSKELQRQVDYFKKYSDIKHIKPAEGMLRKRQLDIVQVSAEFLEIIKELEIKPFLFAGNLLGYVRHNGFIPWDDDIDFALFRDEYEKLKEYCRLHMYTKDEFYNKQSTDKTVTEELEDFYWSNSAGDELNIYKPLHGDSKLVIDFFTMDYYADDYSFDEFMKFTAKVRERLKDFVFNSQERISYFQSVISENRHNMAKESNNIYFGIDNLVVMRKFHRGHWMSKDIVFPLKKVLYEGKYFWVPNDSEEFVNYMYEDIWKFPEDVGISPHEYQYL